MVCFKSNASQRPSISRILSLDAPESTSVDVKSIDAMSAVDITAALNAEDVFPDKQDESNESDKRRVLKMIRHEDFWRTHWEIHSKKSRVKSWLWVHERYRNQLRELLSQTDRSKARAAFDKWCKKLVGHSEFEDEMLFQYFLDNSTSETMKTNLRVLMGHHSDRDQQDKLARILASGDGGKWEDELKSYVDAMLDHLKLEEQIIVGPWLNLDGAEYKKYRSYLNWKNAVMY